MFHLIYFSILVSCVKIVTVLSTMISTFIRLLKKSKQKNLQITFIFSYLVVLLFQFTLPLQKFGYLCSAVESYLGKLCQLRSHYLLRVRKAKQFLFNPCSVTLFFTVWRGLCPVLLEELPFSCIAKDIAYFLVSYSIVPFCKRSIIIFQCLVIKFWSSCAVR